MTEQDDQPPGVSDSEPNRVRIIVAAESKLGEVRERSAAVSARVDTMLTDNRGLAWDQFEAAQAQLLMFLRRAERQVEVLRSSRTSNWGNLVSDLELTWDDLALATQRLVSRMAEASEVKTAGSPDESELQ